MKKIKTLLLMFFTCYFLAYCIFTQLNRVFIYKQEESYYDLSHIEIYTQDNHKNKHVDLQKRNVFKIL